MKRLKNRIIVAVYINGHYIDNQRNACLCKYCIQRGISLKANVSTIGNTI